jgi:hypothetical protein
LTVDSLKFYEQDVSYSKYFVKDNVLQIYPGEHLFIEADVVGNEIKSMKVVKENLNPSKTIELEFHQETNDRNHERMILKVSNPFDKELNYDAMMFVVGMSSWMKTSIIPIPPKLMNFELWNDVIITLVLDNWRLK